MIWGWTHRALARAVLVGLNADGSVPASSAPRPRPCAPVDLVRQGGHVRLTAAVDAGDLVGAQADGASGLTSMATLPPPMTTDLLAGEDPAYSSSPMAREHLHGGDDAAGCPRRGCRSFYPDERRWRCRCSHTPASASPSQMSWPTVDAGADLDAQWTEWIRSRASRSSRGKR